MPLAKLVMLSLIFTAAQASATTVTLDMEGIAPAGNISNEINVTRTFSGYDILINHGHFIDSAWPEAGVTRAGNGTDYLGIDSLEPFVISQTSGAAFTIYSFDATDVFTDASFTPNLPFEVTGTLAGGGTLATTFSSDSETSFQTFVFGSEWTNLTSVLFVGNEHGAYDNIVVSTAVVPVPAAVWLFGSGLVMLLRLGNKSRASATS